MSEKEIPLAVESEEFVCGAILIAPEVLREIEPILTPEQFWTHRYRWVYTSALRLKEKGIGIDCLTIAKDLDTLGKLDEIGGQGALIELLSVPVGIYNAESHAKLINETYVRRQMIDLSSKVSQMAYGEQWGLDQVQSKTVKLVQETFGELATDGEGILASEAMSRQFDRMEQNGKNNILVVPTEFIDLDYLLDGGMRAGNLVLVAGRPGMGKTAFLLDLMKNESEKRQEGYDVFFSLEMSSEELMDRMTAKYGISSRNIRTGKLEENEWSIYTHACERLSKMKFILDDTPGLTPIQLRSKLSKLASKYKLNRVYVDYLQLMRIDGKRENRVQEVSYISRELKLIAREFDIPLVAGAQLSRAVEQRAEKRPVLSDLRESGTLEQDADIVMFLYRPEIYDNDPQYQNIAEVIVAKHRNGAIGSINLIFRKNLMKFENAKTRDIDLNGSSYLDEREQL